MIKTVYGWIKRHDSSTARYYPTPPPPHTQINKEQAVAPAEKLAVEKAKPATHAIPVVAPHLQDKKNAKPTTTAAPAAAAVHHLLKRASPLKPPVQKSQTPRENSNDEDYSDPKYDKHVEPPQAPQ